MTVPYVNPGPAGVELNYPYPAPADSGQLSVAGNTNAAATIALAADSQSPNHVGQVEWSYSSAPTAGRLTIAGQTAGTVRDYDITAAGPGKMDFQPPLVFARSEAVTVTLAAAGNVTGKVAAVAWKLV